jgi:hypothetical protein
MATTRPLIVLHPKYVDEIKSHPHLDFELATKKVGYTIFVTSISQNIDIDTTLTITRTSSRIELPVSRHSTPPVLRG